MRYGVAPSGFDAGAASNNGGEDTWMSGEASAGRRLIGGRSVRWDQARADAAYEAGLWVRETLADTLRRAAEETPHRVLVAEAGRSIDCRTLYAQAQALAQAMLARAAPGDVVSFMLPNWLEAMPIYMAATMAGMVVHPLLPSLRDRDLAFILKDAESRLIFIPATFRNHDYAAMLDRVAAQLETPPAVVVVRGEAGRHMAYDDFLKVPGPARPLPDLDPDAVRMMMYTSGTTGTPKGVLHSHNSIHALLRQLGRHWNVDPGDTFFVPSPISHIGGSIYVFEAPLLLGARAVLVERWDPDEAVRVIEAERCTHTAGATPFLEGLLEAARKAGSRLPSLKVFICGGASVPPSLVRTAAAYFERAAVCRVYGSTEVPVTTVGVLDRNDVTHAAETDGKPGLAEVRLIDADGRDAPEGEIRARGPQMLRGYHHPEEEATVFDAEGFYRTGDIGRWIDGDYLVVSGRAKDIIIRNGENISPKEVEDFLVDHEDILEVTVVGLPDPKTGERACAVIVPKSKPGPDVAALKAFLKAQGVAAFKIPEQVAIWDALPKNDAGKVLKHVVRTELARQLQEG
jgi:acyl-CoA synthetase (AMP-forming)/AMP-acid ligase II